MVIFHHYSQIVCGSDAEMGQGHEPKLTDNFLYRLQPLFPSRILVFEQSKDTENLFLPNQSINIERTHKWSIVS